MDKMLRGLSSQQFQELVVFSELEPTGDERMDMRFALLASVLAHAGDVRGLDGKPYSPKHYLGTLHGWLYGLPSAPVETPKQSIEQQMMLLDSWISGSNKSFKERGLR